MLDEAKCFTDLNKRQLEDVWLASREGEPPWRDMSHPSLSFFLFLFNFLAGGAEICMWVKGKFSPGEDFSFSFFYFPKDQGQEESTPRVVGGKKNNKAHKCLGTTTLLTSSIIISAWLGCLGNLHNTILTPSLQLSITTAVVFSFLAHACLLSVSPLVSLPSPIFFFFSLSSCPLACLCLSFTLSPFVLMFIGPSKKKKKKRWISHHFCPSCSTHRHSVNDEAPSQWRWEICRRELPFCVTSSISGVGGRELP